MSTTIKISNWQIVDIANQPLASPDGGLQYSPERCWFAILNCDTTPHDLLLLDEELDIALRPLDQMEEMGFSAAMGISPSRDPLRRRLAGWFHVFRDPSASMGQIVDGEPVAIGQLHQLACDMHDSGLIRIVDKTEEKAGHTIQKKSITTTDAWRVICRFRCWPISDNTRHFLSLVLRAIDRWQALDAESQDSAFTQQANYGLTLDYQARGDVGRQITADLGDSKRTIPPPEVSTAKRKRGPKLRFDAKADKKLVDAWKASGMTADEFALKQRTDEKPLSGNDIRKAAHRVRARKLRRD